MGLPDMARPTADKRNLPHGSNQHAKESDDYWLETWERGVLMVCGVGWTRSTESAAQVESKIVTPRSSSLRRDRVRYSTKAERYYLV